jgi:hypothetical protein
VRQVVVLVSVTRERERGREGERKGEGNKRVRDERRFVVVDGTCELGGPFWLRPS